MNDPLAFYKLMHYPTPIPQEYFYYKGNTPQQKYKETKQLGSSETVKPGNSIIQKLLKYQRLRKHLPYIQYIYVCDSISFNANHTESDIDLFFITKAGCMRRARFWTVLIFSLLGIKRSLKKKSGLFDLVFYVDAGHTDIEHIALQPEDIYLSYRLAHLIPIYQKKPYNIYTDNKRIQKTLPNFPMQHIPQVHIPIEIQTQSSQYKKTIEKLCGDSTDNRMESLIRSIWKPIVIKKKSKLKSQGRGVVISDIMLKFHKDKRKDIQKQRENRELQNKAN